MADPTVLLTGLRIPESPPWHEGRPVSGPRAGRP